MDLPKRKQIRLPDYEYSAPGAYFVTICTSDRRCILSDIVVGAVEDAGPYKFTVSCADIDNETLYEQTMRRRALAAILSRARGPGRRGLPPDLGIY